MIDKITELCRKIEPQQVLPLILIIIDFLAAIVCVIHKDFKKAIYWAAAGVLNITVTF